MNCRYCGSRMREGISRCPYCGNAVGTRRYLKNTPQKKRPRRRCLPWLFVLIPILLLGAGAVIFFMKNNASEPMPKALRQSVEDAQEAIRALEEAAEDLGYGNALSDLSEDFSEQVDGTCFYRLQQNYEGIPVYGHSVVYVSDENGNLLALTGNPIDIDEELSLDPSVNLDEALGFATAYIEEHCSCSADCIQVGGIGTELNVYYDAISGESCLVYLIPATILNNARFEGQAIVNAHNGKVLEFTVTNEFAMETTSLPSSEGGYLAVDLCRQENDGEITYSMVDENRRIRIYSANGGLVEFELWSYDGRLVCDRNGTVLDESAVYQEVYPKWLSENGITEPVSTASAVFPERAVTLLHHTQYTYDFFKEFFGLDSIAVDGSAVWIHSIYDNRMGSFGTYNAYSWGNNEKPCADAMFTFGTTNAIRLDTVAHEYTHAIEGRRTGLYPRGEAEIIQEAVADIFGELVEAWVSGKDPDWKHTSRNIKAPWLTGNPATYQGMFWLDPEVVMESVDPAHNNCTVLARAAYLMSVGIDGDAQKRLSTEELAHLWYRTILMMPSDCDFTECRAIVEMAAKTMDLSEKQLECIREAFDEVEIPAVNAEDTEYDFRVKPNFTLGVFGMNRQLWDNYTLRIQKQSAISPFFGGKEPEITTYRINEPGRQEIKLEEGKYIFTVIDNGEPNNTVTFTASVSKVYKNKEIEIYTRFGKGNVIGVVYEVRERDGEEHYEAVPEAQLVLYNQFGQKLVIQDQQTNEEGCINLTLEPGNYTIAVSAEGYESVSYSFVVESRVSTRFSIRMEREDKNTLPTQEEDAPQKEQSEDAYLLTEYMAYDTNTAGEEYLRTKCQYIYDDQGVLLEERAYDPAMDMWETTIVSYDASGRKVYTEVVGARDYSTYVYDAQGREISQSIFKDGQLQFIRETSYGANGNVVVTMRDGLNPDLIYFCQETEYDDQQRVIRSETEWYYSGDENYEEVSYFYVDGQTQRAVTRYGDLDAAGNRISEEYYYMEGAYSENGSYWDIYYCDENWNHQFLYQKQHMDENGNMIESIVYSSTGKVFSRSVWVYKHISELNMVADQLIDFSNLPNSYIYTSGVGTWRSEFTLEADGRFLGSYHDSDMGDTGEGYPRGTTYLCDFRGEFVFEAKVDDGILRLSAQNVDATQPMGTEWYENGIRYIVTEPIGFRMPKEYLLFFPGASLDRIPEEQRQWISMLWEVKERVPEGMYIFYSVQEGAFFVGRTN